MHRLSLLTWIFVSYTATASSFLKLYINDQDILAICEVTSQNALVYREHFFRGDLVWPAGQGPSVTHFDKNKITFDQDHTHHEQAMAQKLNLKQRILKSVTAREFTFTFMKNKVIGITKITGHRQWKTNNNRGRSISQMETDQYRFIAVPIKNSYSKGSESTLKAYKACENLNTNLKE